MKKLAKILAVSAVGVLAGGVSGGELPSVTFPGSNYVRTGVVPTVDMRVVCDFQLLTVPTGYDLAGVFGSLAQTADGKNTGWGLRAHGPNNGTEQLKNHWVAWSGNDYVYITNAIDLARHQVELKSGSVRFDDSLYTCDAARDPATAAYAMRGFDLGDQGWGNGAACAQMRFFSMQIYRTVDGVETLVSDLVPYEENGVVGVYDRVKNRLHLQAGEDVRPLLDGAWVRRPSVTPATWSRRGTTRGVLDCGAVVEGATVTCNYTQEQLNALPAGSHRVTFTTVSSDAAQDGKTYTTVVTVEDPFACTFRENGARVDCTFAASTETRTLYLAYGTTDGGETMSGWDHVTALATVPSGVDALTDVAVPEEVLAAAPIMRAFLQEPAQLRTAASYVHHENLIAQWDGVENAGYGQAHDAARTFPAEIRRGAQPVTAVGTMAAEARSFTFGAGYLTYNSKAIAGAINDGRCTIELTMADTGTGYTHNGGLICYGDSRINGKNARGFWSYQQNSWSLSAVSYHALDGQFDEYRLSNGVSTNTYSFVLSSSTAGSFLQQNGVTKNKITAVDQVTATKLNVTSAQLDRFSTDCPDDNLFLGILPGSYIGSNLRAKARVCSIRIYNIALAADEIAANLEIDRKRFSNPFEHSEAFFRDRPLTVDRVTKVDRQPASVDVSFGAAAKVRDLYLVWDVRDAGTTVDGWTQRVKVGEIPAGVASLTGVEIPADVRAALAVAGGFRMVIGTPFTAQSYAGMNSMIAQWDGIENDGYGQTHDAARTYPRELVANAATTNSGTLRCEAKSFSLGDAYMKLNLPSLKAAINEGRCTVELVMAEDGTKVNNGGLFAQGNTSRGIWIYQKNTGGNEYPGLFGDVTYHGKMRGDWNCFNNVPSAGTNTYSFVLGPDTASSYFTFDGERRAKTDCWQSSVPNSADRGATLTRFSTDVADDDLYIGILPGDWLASNLKGRAKICSIRVYGRVLTTDELDENRAVDRIRFSEGNGMAYELSDYVSTAPRGTTILFR